MTPERWAQIEGCRAAQASLSATLEGLADEVVRRPSLLPDWTAGHVLTDMGRPARDDRVGPVGMTAG